MYSGGVEAERGKVGAGSLLHALCLHRHGRRMTTSICGVHSSSCASGVNER